MQFGKGANTLMGETDVLLKAVGHLAGRARNRRTVDENVALIVVEFAGESAGGILPLLLELAKHARDGVARFRLIGRRRFQRLF